MDLLLWEDDLMSMRDRHWMPFYVDDFRMSTLDLKVDEIGAYFTMILLAWQRGDGSLPGDMQQLKLMLQRCASNFHGLTFNRIVPKLLDRYFAKRADGNFYQERVENELRRARELSEKQSRNVRERWSRVSKNKDIADTVVIPTQHNTTQHKDIESSKDSEEGRKRAVRARVNEWPGDYFERFWQAYPRKVAKLDAKKALDAAYKRDDSSFARLLSAVGAINTKDPEFIPYPATWLNRGSYLDGESAQKRTFVPGPDLPTEEELKKQYANGRKVASVAAESTGVLEGSTEFRTGQSNGVGVGGQRNGGIRSLDEIFSMEGVRAVRNSSDTERLN
jgi:uncharacterized protein YdaU (DUF1376 family)